MRARMAAMPPLVDVRDLSVRFAAGPTSVDAVSHVSFSVAKGEIVGLVGESGSGKTVSALSILRLLPASASHPSGEIFYRDKDLLEAPGVAMRAIRGEKISIIFQEPMTSLNPLHTIEKQVGEIMKLHQGLDDAAARERVLELLRKVGLDQPERRLHAYPHQLSGGQRQRVMIAMAVVNRPSLLIADEPTTALDVTIQAQVLDLLRELREKFSLAMLFISHDLAVVSQVAHRIGVMYAGSLVEMGTAQEVFRHPAHPYTRGLLHSVPTLRSERSHPLQTVEGTVPAIAALPPGCAFEPRCSWRIAACSVALPPLVEVAPGHLARCPVVSAEVR
jgi:oligopeptide/dipeptide ABC transporter ATP-binding protein